MLVKLFNWYDKMSRNKRIIITFLILLPGIIAFSINNLFLIRIGFLYVIIFVILGFLYLQKKNL